MPFFKTKIFIIPIRLSRQKIQVKIVLFLRPYRIESQVDSLQIISETEALYKSAFETFPSAILAKCRPMYPLAYASAFAGESTI